jgi:hypothetical protein
MIKFKFVFIILVLSLVILFTGRVYSDGGPPEYARHLYPQKHNVSPRPAYLGKLASSQDNSFNSKDIIIALFGTISALSLVFFVEWLRNPNIEIEIAQLLDIPENELFLEDSKKIIVPKRRILKIKVIVKKDWRKYIPLPKNVHALSKVIVEINWTTKPRYQAKWDTAPEPVDYINKVVKIEMAPLTMQAENLMFGDIVEAGIAAKHDGEDGFYFFDSDYYINRVNNYCILKEVILTITLRSSLKEKKEKFKLKNPNNTINKFTLIKQP